MVIWPRTDPTAPTDVTLRSQTDANFPSVRRVQARRNRSSRFLLRRRRWRILGQYFPVLQCNGDELPSFFRRLQRIDHDRHGLPGADRARLPTRLHEVARRIHFDCPEFGLSLLVAHLQFYEGMRIRPAE